MNTTKTKIFYWLRLYRCVVLDKHKYVEDKYCSEKPNMKTGMSDLTYYSDGSSCSICRKKKAKDTYEHINCRCMSKDIEEPPEIIAIEPDDFRSL